MSEKFDKLSQSLTKHLPEPEVPVVQQNQPIDRDTIDDYEYSRDTYRNLIDNSSEALNGMIALASESEHPRAYEVLSGMVKNIADVTDKLMDLQKKKDDLITKHQPKQEGGVTNNNVFVGSTTDLQRMLLKGDVIEHDKE